MASVFAMATMAIFWFALGCYGFYALFLGGTRDVIQSSPVSLTTLARMQQPSSIIINIVANHGRLNGCNPQTSEAACLEDSSKDGNDGFSSISLDDWNQLKLDVDSAISQILGGNE